MTANSKYLRLRLYALKPIFHIARRDRTRLVHSVTRRPATVIGIETNTFSRLLVSTRLVAGDVAWALITKKLSVSLKNNRDNFTSVCLKKTAKHQKSYRALDLRLNECNILTVWESKR